MDKQTIQMPTSMRINILKNGLADLVRYDINGNKTIVETLKSNDVFGEIFFPVKTNNEDQI